MPGVIVTPRLTLVSSSEPKEEEDETSSGRDEVIYIPYFEHAKDDQCGSRSIENDCRRLPGVRTSINY